VALDELLKRKKARTRSGRKAQRRSARRTVKMLKKEEKDALEIYNDKEKLRKVFDENDKDKSGTLDFDELKELFKKVKMPKDDIEIEEMIEAADADGSGEIEFEEFANVQKKVAEDKRAQWKEWYKDPLLRTTRRFGCTLKDRKRFYKLSYVDADGNEVYGQRKEKKLLKELMAEQKKNDDVVKDWSKIIMDGVTKANLVLVGLRKLFIDSATETMSVSKVFAMVRAKLMDFAIIIGKNMVTSGDLLPALKLSKDFKLLFQGKNPITGVDIIAPDGGCINFDLNKGLEVPLKGLNATMRFIYQTFFQFEHPANLVCIFKTLAVKVKQLCTNAVKLGVRVANFAMKCLPPFPIVGLIQNQVMRICMKSAMSLDFKIRKTPGTIVSNVRKFGGFPSASLKFARGCKGMFKTFLAMAPKDGPKAIGQADEPEDENDEVDPNELGDDFKKGAGRASGAAGAASEANSAQGEFQKKGLSKQDQKEEKFASEKTDAEDDENDESPKKSQVAAAPGVNLSDAALESKFAEIDADGDGTLTKSEMEIALRSDEYSFTDEQVAQMLKAADLDDNNSIDIDEFKEAMRECANA
jgi:calmodulin